jgi:hypothetical protein
MEHKTYGIPNVGACCRVWEQMQDDALINHRGKGAISKLQAAKVQAQVNRWKSST